MVLKARPQRMKDTHCLKPRGLELMAFSGIHRSSSKGWSWGQSAVLWVVPRCVCTHTDPTGLGSEYWARVGSPLELYMRSKGSLLAQKH